ncbi:MAG: SAM-dependent methyltransferase [Acidimicrobiales bacterium]
MGELERAIAERIGEHGPIGFDEFVAHALYAPGLGFYTADHGDGRGAGRRRDFLTSPEVGPLFGAVLARALDAWWEQFGRPDPFVVVEAGAGPGTLARTVLAATPDCGGALRLVLVEPGQAHWAAHPDGVDQRTGLPGPGELGSGPVVVLANELLDNLPFGLVELVDPAGPAHPGGGGLDASADGGPGPTWCEVLVDVAASPAVNVTPAGSGLPPRSRTDRGEAPGPDTAEGAPARFVERFARLDPARQGWCWGRAGRSASVGTRLAVQADAAAWLSDALDLAVGGRVMAIDYASTTTEMAVRPWTDWVRTYAGHARGAPPLEAPGTQDITCEVAVDQLATVRPPDLDRSQAEFLTDHGLDDLLADARRRWAETGIGGGLDAFAARSAIGEAAALTDPTGLGAFRVLEWVDGLRSPVGGRGGGATLGRYC